MISIHQEYGEINISKQIASNDTWGKKWCTHKRDVQQFVQNIAYWSVKGPRDECYTFEMLYLFLSTSKFRMRLSICLNICVAFSTQYFFKWHSFMQSELLIFDKLHNFNHLDTFCRLTFYFIKVLCEIYTKHLIRYRNIDEREKKEDFL
jgi:hypothetical protein